MTTLPPPLSSINSTSSTPWKFLGSVSSVSPVSPLEEDIGTTPSKIKGALNETGFYIDDDGESMLNDLKTVILACVATLVPLIITLAMIFGMRKLWKQHRTRKKARKYDGVLVRENTSGSTSKPLHTHLLDDKGSTETHMDLSYEAVEICEEVSSVSNNRSSNVNGSIITMTLTNSHLIVETEERNDIEEDSRETTMRYSPGARGVFVVEVQQGIRRSPGSGGPASIVEPERSMSLSDQCALVHNPPPEKFGNEETGEECDYGENYVDTASPTEETIKTIATNTTGLSTSNSSLNSQRHIYSYTTQVSYERNYGYENYLGYDESASGGRLPLEEHTKPKITSALYKSNTKSMSFDVGMDKAIGQNSSLDNVLETNGFEEFSTSFFNKSKCQNEEKPAASELDLSENNGDVVNKNLD
ncbi:uncharacterized protein LOC126746759 isoform X2 [Anthonomus grandis grandis]|uniref:uncharacterized protein LOC126746759 isoform X2 n=1 Tax=Anthonomus grandis grandis TaxID=2921223 RepID=UPI0021651924|nr:uncharacterized protein LOC126746759 isoform X2 [Anthonomus grandis grandis]